MQYTSQASLFCCYLAKASANSRNMCVNWQECEHVKLIKSKLTPNKTLNFLHFSKTRFTKEIIYLTSNVI